MSYNRSLMSVVWWKIIPTIHADIPVCCWDLEKESVPSMLLFLLKMNIGHLSGDDGPTRLNGRRIFEDDIVWNALDCKRRMERKTALFSLDRKGYHVSWDAIPAWVCTQ